jgi:hypothetical protein
LADRLSETAYLFWKQEEEALARACLATAAQLRGGESEDNPVVEAFIDGLATQLRAQLVGLAPPAADEADDSEEEMHEAKQE